MTVGEAYYKANKYDDEMPRLRQELAEANARFDQQQSLVYLLWRVIYQTKEIIIQYEKIPGNPRKK